MTDQIDESRILELTVETLLSLPEFMRAARARRGDSIRSAAAGLGMGYSHLARIERGDIHNIKLETALSLLHYIAQE